MRAVWEIYAGERLLLISRRLFLASASSAGFVGRCGSGSPQPAPPPPPPPSPPGPVTFSFSFAEGLAGWEPAYADYALGQEAAIGFAFGHERLPPPLADRSGLYMASRNESDDVFMYAARRVEGLAPSTRYRVRASLAIATNAPPGCFGIGGAPGEAVTIKAGATAAPPQRRIEQNMVRVSFDKGDQSESGTDVVAIGDFAQENPGDCLAPVYQRKGVSTSGSGPTVRSDSSGRLWLIFGTDSGYEGETRLYVLEGQFVLTPA